MKDYESVKLEVVRFETEDVITTSNTEVNTTKDEVPEVS